MKQTYLVTGGMGFVGSHLCESLVKENHDLIILTKSLKKKHNVEGFKTTTLELAQEMHLY